MLSTFREEAVGSPTSEAADSSFGPRVWDESLLPLDDLVDPSTLTYADDTPDAYFQGMIARGVTPAALQEAINARLTKAFSRKYGLGYDDLNALRSRWGIR